MKKIFISALFLLGFGSYALYSQSSAAATTRLVSSSDTSPVSSGITTAVATPAVAAPYPVSMTPAPKKSGTYTDGTYTGTPANAYYGNIQVAAVISGGKLTNVTFLQHPSDRSESQSINQRAMPLLRTEAIAAQSANVNGVSGASDSSAAFIQSLGSALAKAKA